MVKNVHARRVGGQYTLDISFATHVWFSFSFHLWLGISDQLCVCVCVSCIVHSLPIECWFNEDYYRTKNQAIRSHDVFRWIFEGNTHSSWGCMYQIWKKFNLSHHELKKKHSKCIWWCYWCVYTSIIDIHIKITTTTKTHCCSHQPRNPERITAHNSVCNRTPSPVAEINRSLFCVNIICFSNETLSTIERTNYDCVGWWYIWRFRCSYNAVVMQNLCEQHKNIIFSNRHSNLIWLNKGRKISQNNSAVVRYIQRDTNGFALAVSMKFLTS